MPLVVIGVAVLGLRLPTGPLGPPRMAAALEGPSRRCTRMCTEEKYVNPVTAFLGRFLPSAEAQARAEADPLAEIDWDAPKAVLNTDELVTALERGLTEREWFVTGRVMPEYFADDFRFQVLFWGGSYAPIERAHRCIKAGTGCTAHTGSGIHYARAPAHCHDCACMHRIQM